MARAKSKKWAAESLVSETEKKAIASPKEQRKSGELLAGMLGGLGAGSIARKLATKVNKRSLNKIKNILEEYIDPPDDIKFIKSRLAIGVPTAGAGVIAKKRNEKNKKNKKKAKDGSVKKYAKGGGVRAVRY